MVSLSNFCNNLGLLCEFSSSSSLFPEWTIIPPLKHCRKHGGSLPCCTWTWWKIKEGLSVHLCSYKVLKKEKGSVWYLCSSLLIQLHSHQCWCSFLTDSGIVALPEEVAALLLPGPQPRLQLLWVLPLPNWWHMVVRKTLCFCTKRMYGFLLVVIEFTLLFFFQRN